MFPPPFRTSTSGRESVLAMVAVLSLGGGTLAAPSYLLAQGPSSSAGTDGSFWWGVTVGGGGTRLTCDICQPSRDLGPSVDVALGSTAAPDLRVGIEAGGWTHDDDDVRETVYRVGVVAHLSPMADRGLYLIGGFGWSGYRAEDYRYDAPRVSVGAGWDLPFLPGWTVGNQVVLDASSLGSLKNEDTTVVRRVGLSTVRLSIHLRHR